MAALGVEFKVIRRVGGLEGLRILRPTRKHVIRRVGGLEGPGIL